MFGDKTYDNELLKEIVSTCEGNLEVDYDDVLMYLNYLDYKLSEINELEDDMNYKNQIKKTFSIIPKQQIMIISPDLVHDCQNLNHKALIDNEDACLLVKEKMVEVSIVAMKYQYKYYIEKLEQILINY